VFPDSRKLMDIFGVACDTADMAGIWLGSRVNLSPTGSTLALQFPHPPLLSSLQNMNIRNWSFHEKGDDDAKRCDRSLKRTDLAGPWDQLVEFGSIWDVCQESRVLSMSSSDRQVALRPDGTFLLTSACDIHHFFFGK